jgi:putative exosortase-associated protein (TIGR04073 family)
MQRLALVLGLALVVSALAAPTPAQARTPAHKFGRGLANLALGVMEIPAGIIEEDRRNGPLSAASLGFAKGVGGFAPRTLVGLYEVVTFPAPVPRGYRPILEPDYPWELFD